MKLDKDIVLIFANGLQSCPKIWSINWKRSLNHCLEVTEGKEVIILFLFSQCSAIILASLPSL